MVCQLIRIRIIFMSTLVDTAFGSSLIVYMLRSVISDLYDFSLPHGYYI